jgi:hypothetical protein
MTAIRAFKVLETGDGTGGIVYAKTNAQARREGAQQFGSGDFFGVECSRAPQFDLFADGWWMECEECGAHARTDSGGVDLVSGFYCSEHADVYAWRVPHDRALWHQDDFAWTSPASWWPATVLEALKADPDAGVDPAQREHEVECLASIDRCCR